MGCGTSRAAVCGFLASAAAITLPMTAAFAQARSFDIPAQPVSSAVAIFARQGDVQVLIAGKVAEGKTSSALHGAYSVEEGLNRMLRGTDLGVRMTGPSTYVVTSGEASEPIASAGDIGQADDVVVTGSRIKGAPVASTTISVGRAAIIDGGYNGLGDLVRSIPQSFGGGQNPGIGFNVSENSGADVNGGSSVNLRGLGSDATLTLLNGQRVAYSAAVQSVDVSALPLGIVDRIDIVPDGSSALYGSDAVAGVANIVLRPDMKGLEAGARLGASTGGGNFEQQYDGAAGTRWATGGFIVAYDHDSSSAVWGRQRSYASITTPGLSLMPRIVENNVAFNAHQGLMKDVTLQINGYYSNRIEYYVYPLGGINTSRYHDQIYGFAPSVKWQINNNWQISINGTYGREKVNLFYRLCDTCAYIANGYYANKSNSAELSANGSLIDLPGGAIKLAAGSGYQHIEFTDFYQAGSASNSDNTRNDYYAFGELAIPLIGAAQDIPFVEKLSLSAAVRYERYPGIAKVATPKLGLIYSPNGDFDIKATWGKSFRAPTMYEEYKPGAIFLFPAAELGASGAPATATALESHGGNPDLKPERATTWSAGVTYHPSALPGAKMTISYFNINYRDRIVQPIANTDQALSNPIYSAQIRQSPSSAAQAALIAASGIFYNGTSDPYDPANVIAIVNDENINAGHQWIHGLDFLAEYDAALGAENHILASVDLTYLQSRQKLEAGQSVTQLAGTIFNPPHWRGRADIDWKRNDLNVDLAANMTGGVQDNRTTDPVWLHGMTTIDMTARYDLRHLFKPIGDTAVTLQVKNLFNAKPAAIAVTNAYDTPYDSTNYSPMGRFIGFGVSTKW